MSKFCVGDLVRIVNSGTQYTTYKSFFENNLNIPIEAAARWAFDSDIEKVYPDYEDMTFHVEFVGEHHMFGGQLCLISANGSPFNKLFLFGSDGLALVKRTFSVPCEFVMYADVRVEAGSFEEAKQLAVKENYEFNVDEDRVRVVSSHVTASKTEW
jgi:hypothetical protein